MSSLDAWVQGASVLLLLTAFALLGTGRITTGIRLLAGQGALLAIIILLGVDGGAVLRGLALAAATLVLKAVLFPWLLARAQREARIQEELQPFVGYQLSVFGGIVALGVAIWLSGRLDLAPSVDPLPVAVGLFMSFAGLFMLVTRRIAIGQVFGYLVLENGIALFGLSVAQREPLVIELGILLDVFVAVFVMGIAIAHINREFDHIEVDRLAALKD